MASAKKRIKIVALVKLNFSTLVAREVDTISNLKGHKIAYTRGSSAHYALLQALELAGMTESDIELVPMGVKKMRAALEAGDVDAFVAWEPTPTSALQQHASWVVLHRTLNSSYLYFEKEFAQQQSELAKLLVASHIRAVAWMQRSRKNLMQASRWALAAAEKFRGEKSNLDAQTIAKLTREGLLDVAASAQVPPHFYKEGGRLADEFALLKRVGKVPVDLPWGEVAQGFDNSWVREIRSDPQEWRLYEFAYQR